MPMIGCRCPVCLSSDSKNKRTRSGLILQGDEGSALLVDAPPELRLQLTREGISEIEAVILTHSHADHVMGMDDLRSVNYTLAGPVPIYARPEVLEDVRRIFRYAFLPPDQPGGGIPSFDLRDAPELLRCGGLEIELFPVLHGSLPVLAVKARRFAYLTDVSRIPDEAWPRLQGLDTLILDATRRRPHPSHFHLDLAVETAQALGARKTYLTHLSHDYDYEETNRSLPDGIELSYDGLRIEIE